MRRDGGVVYVCNLIDTAADGDMPKRVLQRKGKFWYEDRVVGYGRYYAALGANEMVDMLVRIAYSKAVRIGMYAVLGNGDQFRISNVQVLKDEDDLRCIDLTLTRLEQNYELDG